MVQRVARFEPSLVAVGYLDCALLYRLYMYSTPPDVPRAGGQCCYCGLAPDLVLSFGHPHINMRQRSYNRCELAIKFILLSSVGQSVRLLIARSTVRPREREYRSIRHPFLDSRVPRRVFFGREMGYGSTGIGQGGDRGSDRGVAWRWRCTTTSASVSLPCVPSLLAAGEHY